MTWDSRREADGDVVFWAIGEALVLRGDGGTLFRSGGIVDGQFSGRSSRVQVDSLGIPKQSCVGSHVRPC